MIHPDLLDNTASLANALKEPFAVIKDAFIPEKAERLYAELMGSSHWAHQSIKDGDFRYERDSIKMGSDTSPPSLRELYTFLNSARCLQWISEISGRQCDAFLGAAAIFNPGDQITEHNDKHIVKRDDGTRAVRAVTFTYYLTKDWAKPWGGQFVWNKPYTEIEPEFNTLVLFNVGDDTQHWVAPVNDSVTAKRLSVTGWFLRTIEKPGLSSAKSLKLKI